MRILLDTNLLIAKPDPALLPGPPETMVYETSALCLAEMLEGQFSPDPVDAALAGLQYEETKQTFGDGLPFGASELAAYRAVCAAVTRNGRSLTRARRLDMMIAATALANGLTLATRNIDDFAAVAAIVPVVML